MMFGRKKRRNAISYDTTGKVPVIRSSICTGEQVAGFKDPVSGKFQELMLIRDSDDLMEFLSSYQVDEKISNGSGRAYGKEAHNLKIRRIALIGAGAIGAYLIWSFERTAGITLTVVAEGTRAERLKRDGIIINGAHYPLRVQEPAGRVLKTWFSFPPNTVRWTRLSLCSLLSWARTLWCSAFSTGWTVRIGWPRQ